MSEADASAPGEPIPLDDALVTQLRDLAAFAGDGAVARVADQHYRHQGTVGVPSSWLVEIIDRMRVAELHCGYRKQVGKSPIQPPAPDVASVPALTAFERAQLRATALSMLVDPRHSTLLDHPSFARAVDLVVDWFVAPVGTRFPTIWLTTLTEVRPDPHGVHSGQKEYVYRHVACGQLPPVQQGDDLPEGLL